MYQGYNRPQKLRSSVRLDGSINNPFILYQSSVYLRGHFLCQCTLKTEFMQNLSAKEHGWCSYSNVISYVRIFMLLVMWQGIFWGKSQHKSEGQNI